MVCYLQLFCFEIERNRLFSNYPLLTKIKRNKEMIFFENWKIELLTKIKINEKNTFSLR